MRAPVAQRSRRLERLGPSLLAVGLVAALGYALLQLAAGGPQEQAGPFGQHYDGLEGRRISASVPTMADADAAVHAHARLRVYVRSRQVSVPAGIGIHPDGGGGSMAALHTHDDGGTIHVEGMRSATLGQFFRIWGVPLSRRKLGPYVAGSGERVRARVDGKPTRALASLELRDGQQVEVRLEPRAR